MAYPILFALKINTVNSNHPYLSRGRVEGGGGGGEGRNTIIDCSVICTVVGDYMRNNHLGLYKQPTAHAASVTANAVYAYKMVERF